MNHHVDNANESREAAQWWLLFAIMVAGKGAPQTAKKLQAVLDGVPSEWILSDHAEPFHVIRTLVEHGCLRKALENHRVGQYTRITKAYTELVAHRLEWGDDPRCWQLSQIEGIPGVGPKTSRWWWMLAHPEAKVAALDTHILKFLRDQGYVAPMSTPQNTVVYNSLEQRFIEHAAMMGLTPQALDFFVWSAYRTGFQVVRRKKDGSTRKPKTT